MMTAKIDIASRGSYANIGSAALIIAYWAVKWKTETSLRVAMNRADIIALIR